MKEYIYTRYHAFVPVGQWTEFIAQLSRITNRNFNIRSMVYSDLMGGNHTRVFDILVFPEEASSLSLATGCKIRPALGVNHDS